MEGANREFPLARTDDLLVDQVESELVIYDRNERRAHCLSALAAAVFELSDGHRSMGQLTSSVGARLGEPVAESRVEEAVAELDRLGLMVTGSADLGISRRHMIRKGAAVSTAVVGTALVTTLSFSGIAHAASCGGACANGTPGQTACRARGGTTCNCTGPNGSKTCTT